MSSVAGLELGNCWVIREGIRRRCVREWIKRGEDFREREVFREEFRDGLSFRNLSFRKIVQG